MGQEKLSHKLIDLGFLPVLGTVEHGKISDDSYIKRGEPNTYDRNNGVMVVYDEKGWPWIMRRTTVVGVAFMGSLVDAYSLKHGAYVPHSNDGGHFIRHVLPRLV